MIPLLYEIVPQGSGQEGSSSGETLSMGTTCLKPGWWTMILRVTIDLLGTRELKSSLTQLCLPEQSVYLPLYSSCRTTGSSFWSPKWIFRGSGIYRQSPCHTRKWIDTAPHGISNNFDSSVLIFRTLSCVIWDTLDLLATAFWHFSQGMGRLCHNSCWRWVSLLSPWSYQPSETTG